jgi:hypothetical protein
VGYTCIKVLNIHYFFSLISPHVANLFLNRTFSIFYVLFSVVIIAMALGNIGAIKLTIRQEKKKFDMLHKKLDLNSIIAMDDDGDGVDRIEFLTAMLMQMNGLSKEDDIDPWLKVEYLFLYVTCSFNNLFAFPCISASSM